MFDKTHFFSFNECFDVLCKRLLEKPPGRVQLLVGPRQVGKTTLLLKLDSSFQPLVLCEAEDTRLVERMQLKAMSWQNFLLHGLG